MTRFAANYSLFIKRCIKSLLVVLPFLMATQHALASEVLAIKEKTVILYGTSWCGYCKKARIFLQEEGIEFTNYDIENSVQGRKQYEALHGHGVPLIIVGSRRIEGFDKARLKEALESEGLLKRP